jgi:hypothetical protein
MNIKLNNIFKIFEIMKKSDIYLKESKILDDGLAENINTNEIEEWWK